MAALRRLRIAALSAFTILLMTAIAPSTASALSPPLCTGNEGPATIACVHPTPLASANHIGWVYLNLNYCPPGRMCAERFQVSTPAWSWTNAGWQRASLEGGWVYVYPYTSPWRWAWTRKTGWVAVSGGRFEIRSW